MSVCLLDRFWCSRSGAQECISYKVLGDDAGALRTSVLSNNIREIASGFFPNTKYTTINGACSFRWHHGSFDSCWEMLPLAKWRAALAMSFQTSQLALETTVPAQSQPVFRTEGEFLSSLLRHWGGLVCGLRQEVRSWGGGCSRGRGLGMCNLWQSA